MASLSSGLGGGQGFQKFFTYTAGFGHGEFFCKLECGCGEGNGEIFSREHNPDSRIHRPIIVSFSRASDFTDNFPYELIQYWK